MTTDGSPRATAPYASAANGRPSHEIPVRIFEVKLIWPVFLQPRRHDGKDFEDNQLDPNQPDFLQKWVDVITQADQSHWEETNSSFPPLTGAESGPGYAEFCYFHPFVRNFLYVNRDDVRSYYKSASAKDRATLDEAVQKSPNRNLRLLKRRDLEEATLDVEYSMMPDAANEQRLNSCFEVKSSWLYLFDTQIALLELHLNYRGTTDAAGSEWPLNLRMVLRIQDIIRRIYTAYWEVFTRNDGMTYHKDDHVPLRMVLRRHRESGVEPVVAHFGNFQIPESDLSTAAVRDLCAQRPLNSALAPDQLKAIDAATEQREFAYRHREPFTNAVWKDLLSPLVPLQLVLPGKQALSGCALSYEHIQDDRCPLMSYLAIGEPQSDVRFDGVCGIRQISQGDWQRLSGIDNEGNSQCWPFSPTFVEGDPLRGFAYDRYWHATGQVPAQDYHTTRWLCSASSFSGVGKYDEDVFFTDQHAGALGHFRHHYSVLVLVALFHRASLLRYKHALSENAVEWLNSGGDRREERFDQFREKTVQLQQQLLRFRAFYWISEVSNQTQGQELFVMLRKHLNLQQLYDDVCVDIENASTVLRQEAENKRQQATWTLTLLGLGFFFVNLLGTPIGEFIKGPSDGLSLRIAAVLLLALGFIGLLARTSLLELLGRLVDGLCCSPHREHAGPWGKWLLRYQDSGLCRVLPLLAILLGGLLVGIAVFPYESLSGCSSQKALNGSTKSVAGASSSAPATTPAAAVIRKPAATTPPVPAVQTPASAASQETIADSGSKESPNVSAPQ